MNVAKPEFLDSFELGFKSQWLERHVQFNVSAFYYIFKDQQFRNPAPGTTGCSSNNPLATQLVNAAKSRIYGVEFETLARLTNAFDVSIGVGLLESEYQELFLFDSANAVTRDLEGNEVLEAPPYTVNAAANYSIPVGAGTIVVHADAVWVGRQFYTAFNDIEPFDDSVDGRRAWMPSGDHKRIRTNFQHPYGCATLVRPLGHLPRTSHCDGTKRIETGSRTSQTRTRRVGQSSKIEQSAAHRLLTIAFRDHRISTQPLRGSCARPAFTRGAHGTDEQFRGATGSRRCDGQLGGYHRIDRSLSRY